MTKRALFWLLLLAFFIFFLFSIRSVLLPFVLGALTAYFLDPAVDRLERHRLSRLAATSIMTITFFAAFGLLAAILLPLISEQLLGLITALPEFATQLSASYEGEVHRLLVGLPPEVMENVQASFSTAASALLRLSSDFMTGALQSGLTLINLLSLLMITPVVAFYLLRDWDGIIKTLYGLFPTRHAATIEEQLAIMDRTISGFIRGQLNVCAILCVYYVLCLSLVGLKFSIVIGLMAGILVIIPYMGFFVSFILGMSIAFFQFDSHTSLLLTLGVFLLAQVLESYVLTPKLVGEQVGLHPVWIIFGMLAGGALFGFVGVLLAVPLTAMIGVLIRFAISRYLASSYYKGV